MYTLLKTSTIVRALYWSALSFLLPASAWAQTTIRNPLSKINSIEDLVKQILQIVVDIGVPLAVLAIIYSGFLFVTAGGNDTKLEAAKKAFFAAIIGSAIILGAWIIATAIKSTVNSLN